jgi:hypothetical protein
MARPAGLDADPCRVGFRRLTLRFAAVMGRLLIAIQATGAKLSRSQATAIIRWLRRS